MQTALEVTPFESILSVARGSRPAAIQAILEWQWEAWKLALEMPAASGTSSTPKTLKGRVLSREDVTSRLARTLSPTFSTEEGMEISNLLFQHLESLGLCWETKYGATVVSSKALEPVRLLRTLCAEHMSDEDIRYSVFSSIRKDCRCSLSSEIANLFHALADSINRELIAPAHESAETTLRPRRLSWHFYREFVPVLQNIASRIGREQTRNDAVIKAFIGVARAVNYLQLDHKPEFVVCLTREIDAEYLISSLFGLPTRMKGFDQLFGGGLLLVEDAPFDKGPRIKGRVVLASGRYATGKSLLALQVAVEVATKGGIAVILALEQPPEECLYTLESMRLLPNNGSIDIATTTAETSRLLSEVGELPLTQRGALVLIEADKSSYEEFLGVISDIAKSIKAYPLRLIVVDPINAINKGESVSVVALRGRTLSTFEKVKASGTNVWFNAEDNAAQDGSFFERNIADTVIHLSATEHHGNVQRYMEIQKSRLQREQRGKHPFEIHTGQGIRVYPSSASVSERIRSRTPRVSQTGIGFGVKTLDAILGSNAISEGNVVVLQGPSGCFKTILGLHFLHGATAVRGPSKQWTRATVGQNLLFATGDSELSLRWMLNQMSQSSRDGASGSVQDTDPVSVQSLPDGHVHPGQILQEIESAIGLARYANYAVERVMIDNLSHWQLSCPFLRDDEIFGTTLVELLRRQDVTSVLICGAPADDTSRLQASVVENADCVIQFDSIPFQGKSQVMLRVIKSRDMNHRRDWFEVYRGSQSVEVRPIPSLLRVSTDGTVSRSPIRLFLYSETAMQARYHRTLKRSIAAVVSRDVRIDSTASYNPSRSMLSQYSILDELQVIELDEYQAPNQLSLKSQPEVIRFDGPGTPINWDEVLPRLVKRVEGPYGKLGVPYYANISVLAFRANVAESQVASWHSIAATAEEHFKNDPDSLFFDFVKTTDEDYNCFFLEVMLSLMKIPIGSDQDDFIALLNTSEAVEALSLFRLLARRPHIMEKQLKRPSSLLVKEKAQVWRHWYTTINQMLSGMSPDERSCIRVTPLPGDVSLAGEWFLAVPSHSAAPELAMKLVAMMTSKEAESDRMRLGVGLPTRERFYSDQQSESHLAIPISPFFSMKLGVLHDLVVGSFCRSQFAGYVRIAAELTSHLRRTLESETFSEVDAKEVLRSLKSRLRATL